MTQGRECVFAFVYIVNKDSLNTDHTALAAARTSNGVITDTKRVLVFPQLANPVRSKVVGEIVGRQEGVEQTEGQGEGFCLCRGIHRHRRKEKT